MLLGFARRRHTGSYGTSRRLPSRSPSESARRPRYSRVTQYNIGRSPEDLRGIRRARRTAGTAGAYRECAQERFGNPVVLPVASSERRVRARSCTCACRACPRSVFRARVFAARAARLPREINVAAASSQRAFSNGITRYLSFPLPLRTFSLRN